MTTLNSEQLREIRRIYGSNSSVANAVKFMKAFDEKPCAEVWISAAKTWRSNWTWLCGNRNGNAGKKCGWR